LIDPVVDVIVGFADAKRITTTNFTDLSKVSQSLETQWVVDRDSSMQKKTKDKCMR
jgi:hypothetical protein